MNQPAHDGLAERDAAVQEAKQRVGDAETEVREASRRLTRAEEPLLDYHRAVGRGDQRPDDKLEDRLRAELADATGGLTMRPEQIPFGGGMSEVRLVGVDAAAEARLEGAKEALRDREGELKGYVGRHLGELAAERAPRSQEIEQAANAVLTQARQINAEWERERSWWARVCVLAEREALLATLPHNPMAWLQEAPREAGLPLPEPFVR
jgi:hypothetical protein